MWKMMRKNRMMMLLLGLLICIAGVTSVRGLEIQGSDEVEVGVEVEEGVEVEDEPRNDDSAEAQSAAEPEAAETNVQEQAEEPAEPEPEEEPADGVSTMDFVLIVDGSDSMDNSDPNALYISAAKMFIDMLPSENARLAVISFGPDYGEDAWQGRELTGEGAKRVRVFYDLANITDQESKEAAKAAVDEAAAITKKKASLT